MNPILARSVCYTAAAVTLWVLATAVAGSIHYLRPGPSFDYWESAMPFLQSAVEGPWQWSRLWERSGDAHHLLASRILFFLDWQLDDFRGRCLLASAWIALASSALLLTRTLRQAKPDRDTWCIALVFIGLGFGSAHHMNNLAYTFNQQWTCGLLLSLLWIQGLQSTFHAANNTRRLVYGTLTLLAGLLLAATTFSLPSLFFSWVAMSLVLPVRRAWALALTLLLLGCLLAYGSTLPHLSTGHELPNGESLASLAPKLLAYITLNTLRYLGSPVAEYSLPAGLLLAGAALWPYAQLYRRILHKQPLGPFEQLAAGFGMFVAVMALSTAIGRLDPAQAISPRFRTFVMPFLACSAILALLQLHALPPARRRLGQCALLVSALAVTLPGHWKLLAKFGDEYDRYVPPFVALATGLTQRDAIHQSPIRRFQEADNRQMLKYRDFLQQQHKGIYATPFYHQLGSTITLTPARPSPTRLIALSDGAYRWEGTTNHCDSSGRIAVVDEAGVVIGSGIVRRSLSGAGWALAYRIFMPYCDKNHRREWVAYLPPHTPAGKNFRAVAFHRDGTTETLAGVQLP